MILSFVSVIVLWTTVTWAAPQATQDAIAVVPVFRNDYAYDQKTNSFYKEHKVKDQWNEAVWTCQAEGARLAVPETSEEAAVLLEHFSPDTVQVWLAIHDKFSEGDFVTHYGKNAADVYINWLPGEPNDMEEEDCVLLNREGKSNDIRCNWKMRYICVKKNDEPITLSLECQTYDKGYIYKQQTKTCYKFHNKPRTWHEATRICRAEQATLGDINSDAEADVYMNEFEKFPVDSLKGNFNKAYIHLDFSDLVIPGVFANIRNEPLDKSGYVEWAENQPDNTGGNEHCGSMNRNGRLNDLNCSQKAMFICKMKRPEKKINRG